MVQPGPQVGVRALADAHAWAVHVCPEAIPAWRTTVADAFRAWGAAPPAVDLARLGITELLANVLRHAGDPRCSLGLHRIGTTAVVSVFDRSPALPRITEPAWESESGRGLWLLRQMTGPTPSAPNAPTPRPGKSSGSPATCGRPPMALISRFLNCLDLTRERAPREDPGYHCRSEGRWWHSHA